MTNGQVVERFAARTINKRTGEVTGQGHSIVADGRVLKDRGWWPLAYYLGEQKGKHLFLKQGDRYSISTSRHQSDVQRNCSGPTVSFTALQAAGLRAQDVERTTLRDYNEDTRIDLVRKDKDSPWQRAGEWNGSDYGEPTPFKRPAIGMLIDYGNDKGEWHILGGALFKDAKGRHLLASLDERMYFVAELAHPARTVASAFKQLKPQQVQRAERMGMHVKRHGEWFFVPPTSEDGRYSQWPQTDRDLADAMGLTLTNFRYYQTGYYALPDPREARPGRGRANYHVTRWCEVGGQVYAKGKVTHRAGPTRDSRLTREHSTVDLGDVWHRVYRNTERESWGMGGRFD